MHLIDRLGFDPVDGGPLAKGKLLEPDGSPYAETLSADALACTMQAAKARSPAQVPGQAGSNDRQQFAAWRTSLISPLR